MIEPGLYGLLHRYMFVGYLSDRALWGWSRITLETALLGPLGEASDLHQNRRHVLRHSCAFHSELKGLIGGSKALGIWATNTCPTLYVHLNVMWHSARFTYPGRSG